MNHPASILHYSNNGFVGKTGQYSDGSTYYYAESSNAGRPNGEPCLPLASKGRCPNGA